MKMLTRDSITIKRYVAPSYVNGRAVVAAPTSTTAAALVTPVGVRDTAQLESEFSLQRLTGAIKVFSETEIRTMVEGSLIPADVVTYGGRDYDVVRVDRWIKPFGGSKTSHYRAICLLAHDVGA